jgi:hypothetical protein
VHPFSLFIGMPLSQYLTKTEQAPAPAQLFSQRPEAVFARPLLWDLHNVARKDYVKSVINPPQNPVEVENLRRMGWTPTPRFCLTENPYSI